MCECKCLVLTTIEAQAYVQPRITGRDEKACAQAPEMLTHIYRNAKMRETVCSCDSQRKLWEEMDLEWDLGILGRVKTPSIWRLQ